MIRVSRSSVIPLPLAVLWRAVRDFGAVDRWHPLVARSLIEDGRPADRVGCVRHLTLKDGGVIRERLLALSDKEHFFSYSILESPLPVANYEATLRLLPVSDGDASYALWSVEFETAPDREDELRTLVGDEIFQAGFDGMKAAFA